MLSIGAMGHGQGAYYVGLAREDYYLEGGEPPGLWYGRGAQNLGLAGQVDGAALTPLFEGFHPHTGGALIQNAGELDHQPGWDLTFSAPKSVSVFWSQAAPELRREIQEAHLKAVQAALGYLQEYATYTRRGKGGRERELAYPVIATFEHGTSRAQDPQLHTHALMLNVCVRADGTTGTIESKPLYRAKMVAGALYRAEFAFQLEACHGLPIERRGTGFEVSDVHQPLIREFSKRRSEIEELLDKKGFSGAVAAATATLHTRGAKEHIPREQLFANWLETGLVFGWSQTQTKELLGKAPSRDAEAELRSAVETATERATEQQSWFTEAQFVRLLAEEAQGRGMGARAVCTAAAAYLAESPHIVPLGRKEGERVYTTREMMALEAQLLAAVERSRDQVITGVSAPILQSLIASRKSLSEEQAAALQHITQEGGRIQLVSGMAGTGKTSLLHTARLAWELQGFEVYGAALSGKAAKGLADGAGIRTETLHRTLFDLQNGRLRLSSRSVLVLDEAGMVGTRLMKALVEATERNGARLVAVGDARQLQPIEAGGPFSEMQRRLGAAELTEIRRQREDWAREAVHDFADGLAGRGLRAYAERGLLTITDDRHEAMKALVASWKEGGIRSPEEQLIFSGTREEAVMLNRLAQQERRDAAVLGEESLAAPGGGIFYTGDRVLFTRKSRLLGVENGSLGEIASLDTQTKELFVRLDTEERIRVPLEDYEHVRLGYAVTTHKGQGATVERAFVLAGGPMQDREISYVQGSRARGDTRIFVDRAEAGEGLVELIRHMNHSRQKELAHVLQARSNTREEHNPDNGF
jgi:conjugative relaxase-like TrwC/TraI family protein